MAKSEKAASRKKSQPTEKKNDVCFIISPIGSEGTEKYTKFKEVLEFIIQPALESSSLKLRVIRADDINRSGSFIKDILEYIYSSYIVIADLTDQNPNVFYELGVRHSVSPRTILIAQTLEDIPSDLREYRTIIYDTSAKGSHNFRKKIHQFIKQIEAEPDRSDNPVLDRLPDLSDIRHSQLENEIKDLKDQITNILTKGNVKTNKETKIPLGDGNIKKRTDRIKKIIRADYQGPTGGSFNRMEEMTKKSYRLPYAEGNFRLYFLKSEDDLKISEFVYMSELISDDISIDEELADIRVLMELISNLVKVNIKFIIITNSNLVDKVKSIQDKFSKLKLFLKEENRPFFKLEIWDKAGLLKKEKSLGLILG